MSATTKFLIIGFVLATALISLNMAAPGAKAKAATTKAPTNGTTPSPSDCGCDGGPNQLVIVLVKSLIGFVQQLVSAIVTLVVLIITLITDTGKLNELLPTDLLDELDLGNLPLGEDGQPQIPIELVQKILQALVPGVLEALNGILGGILGGAIPSVPL